MRVFAGWIEERDLVAAPWVPDASLDGAMAKSGRSSCQPALDCPGFYAVSPDDRMMLLGEITVHVNRLVHVGERCTVIGWALRASGRKHGAGTAVFDEDGEVCGLARALWIEPRGLGVAGGPPGPVSALVSEISRRHHARRAPAAELVVEHRRNAASAEEIGKLHQMASA